jgi:hypothetical protein
VKNKTMVAHLKNADGVLSDVIDALYVTGTAPSARGLLIDVREQIRQVLFWKDPKYAAKKKESNRG